MYRDFIEKALQQEFHKDLAFNVVDVEGYLIITGFDDLKHYIDPIASREKVEEILSDHKEYQNLKTQFDNLKAELKSITNRIVDFSNVIEYMISQNVNPEEIEKITNLIQEEKERFNKIDLDAISIKSQMDEIYLDVLLKNRILFHLPPILKTFSNKTKFKQFINLVKKIQDDYSDYDDIEYPVQIVYEENTDSFKIIKDLRNKEVIYYQNREWVEKSITTLQESNEIPNNFVLKNRITKDLDSESLKSYFEFSERKRIMNMSQEEREREKSMQIEGLKLHASKMRFELEMEGDPDAFEKAKNWFLAEKQKIEEKYSV
jgi:hypothetical protein